MQKSKFSRKQILFTLLTIGFVVFIFGNSLQNAEVSSEQSGGAVKWMEVLFHSIGLSVTVSEHFIRKTAHFAEYTGLGALLGLTLRAYTDKIRSHLFIPLFVGLAVPVADEYIQLFVDGRGSMVSDVVLDFTGVITGLSVTLLCVWLADRRKLSHTDKGDNA